MWFVITELCFVWGSCLIMFICTFVFILFHWCAKRFPCQMTLGSLSINTTCDSNGAGTAYPSPTPEFLMGFALFNVYFYVVYCYSLFVLFRSAIVLFCPSSICGLRYLRTFLSGITFIPYSPIQTYSSKNTKGDKLNKQYRLLNVTYFWKWKTSVLSQWTKLIGTYVYSDDMPFAMYIYMW
jgi:hypothetical protein